MRSPSRTVAVAFLRGVALALVLAGSFALAFGALTLALGCQPARAPAAPGRDPLPKIFAYLTADALDTLGPLYLQAIEDRTRAAWAGCEGETGPACRAAAVEQSRVQSARVRERIKAAVALQHVVAGQADALGNCALASDCYHERAQALLASLGELRLIVQTLRAEICGAAKCGALDTAAQAVDLIARAVPEPEPLSCR